MQSRFPLVLFVSIFAVLALVWLPVLCWNRPYSCGGLYVYVEDDGSTSDHFIGIRDGDWFFLYPQTTDLEYYGPYTLDERDADGYQVRFGHRQEDRVRMRPGFTITELDDEGSLMIFRRVWNPWSNWRLWIKAMIADFGTHGSGKLP